MQARVAEVGLAQSQLGRGEQLHQRGVASDELREIRRAEVSRAQARLEEARAQLQATTEVPAQEIMLAESEVAAAKARLNGAMEELALTEIRSPVDGVVLKIRAKSGELVSHRQIMDIGNINAPKIVAEVDERLVPNLRLGQSVRASLRGQNVEWHGTDFTNWRRGAGTNAPVGGYGDGYRRPDRRSRSRLVGRHRTATGCRDWSCLFASKRRDGMLSSDLFSFAITLSFQQARAKVRRNIVAFAGIAGGIVLVLVQLGFQSALYDSAVRLHRILNGEIVVIASEFRSIQDPTWFSREWLVMTQAHPAVASVAPLYLSPVAVRNIDDRTVRTLLGIGIELDEPALKIERLGRRSSIAAHPGANSV